MNPSTTPQNHFYGLVDEAQLSEEKQQKWRQAHKIVSEEMGMELEKQMAQLYKSSADYLDGII